MNTDPKHWRPFILISHAQMHKQGWLSARSTTAWLHIRSTSSTKENKDKEKGQAGSRTVCVMIRERPEMVAPADCWNRGKWGLMQYKWRGPSLIGLMGSPRRHKRLLSCLGCSFQPSTKYFFPNRPLFQFICPQCPATGAGSRAGPPVSECVCPVMIS